MKIFKTNLLQLMLAGSMMAGTTACEVKMSGKAEAEAEVNIHTNSGNNSTDVNVKTRTSTESELNIKTNTGTDVTIDETETHKVRHRKKVSNNIVIERQINSLQRKLETDTKFEIKDGEIVNPPIGATIRIVEKLKDREAKASYEMSAGKLTLVVTKDKTNYITQMYGTKARWSKAFLKSMEGDSQLKGGGSVEIKVDIPDFNTDDN